MEEIAVTSCLNDPVVSVYAWDVRTGTSLMTYRGDCAVTPVGVSLLAGQYLVAAMQDKPFLRVWPVNSQHTLTSLRFVCPGRVSHVQASPDNCYIAVTVGEKVHLYQVANGRLVGSGVRHFQPISVLQWTKCGTELVCGGEDGLVTVWPLAILATPRDIKEPRLTFSHHTLSITDLTVTSGTRPRLVSVSADHTCKIYDLKEGTLLISLVFDKTLTAVAVSTLETEVFVGTDSGNILQFSLLSPPRQLDYHLTMEENAPMFTGHTKAVKCLHASADGTLLMSGSVDGTVKLWPLDSTSRQCIRTFTHKGPISNAFFAFKPKQMFDNELKPSVVLNSFQSMNGEMSECVEVITQQQLTLCSQNVKEDFDSNTLSQRDVASSSDDRVKSLKAEIDLLKTINSNLYKFTVDKIITGNTFKPHVPKVVQIESARSKKKKKKKNSNIKPVDSEKGSFFVSSNNPNITSVNGLAIIKKKKRKRPNKKREKTSRS